ncbi:MAG: trehalose-6-phosphate hydrolase, partial [Pseudomonadota bacterium]|nr:trehalose-6-phosphate hydrolase [Pseudomonadota bacterium]
ALNAARLLAERGHSEAEILAILQAKSRDNARTPMQWDDSLHAGFTSGTPWIEVSANYPQLNAQRVISQDASIYHYYRKLSQLRKSSAAIVTGEYQVYFADDPQLYVYTRSLANEVILVINNFYATSCNFTVPEALQTCCEVEYLLNNYPEQPDNWQQFTLRPYQSVVLLLQ